MQVVTQARRGFRGAVYACGMFEGKRDCLTLIAAALALAALLLQAGPRGFESHAVAAAAELCGAQGVRLYAARPCGAPRSAGNLQRINR